jgi:WS/DGAT C-terminal domain
MLQTINDVICGVIFYGINLYVQSFSHNTNATDVTALVLLNTRMLRTYQHLQEMNKPETRAPWGNHFALLHVSVPICKNIVDTDPLYFLTTARKIINTKKNSLSVFFTGLFLEAMRKLRGAEVITLHYTQCQKKKRTLEVQNI